MYGCDGPSSLAHISPQPLQREGELPDLEFLLHVSIWFSRGPIQWNWTGVQGPTPGVHVRDGAPLKGIDAGHEAGKAHSTEGRPHC